MCRSGEGVGLNVRRMMLDFVSSFTVAYSLRPIGDIGTVYRRYPSQWKVVAPSCSEQRPSTNPPFCRLSPPHHPLDRQALHLPRKGLPGGQEAVFLREGLAANGLPAVQVFIEDAALPGRFTLAAERSERPAGDFTPPSVHVDVLDL